MGTHTTRSRSSSRRPSPPSQFAPALGSAPLCFEPADSAADSAAAEIRLPQGHFVCIVPRRNWPNRSRVKVLQESGVGWSAHRAQFVPVL